ncbi:transposase [Streptomyces sp. NPDC026589]|uniref:transposase n=1 Tax=Streptomyces sp. NPDC026589 TaxID=3155609 RepID=UPI0033CA67A6
MKNYPPEFRADLVALYESRPDAAIRSVAADLGINPETLRNWVRAAGTSRPWGRRTREPAQPPVPLEAENAALRKKVRELDEERETPQGRKSWPTEREARLDAFRWLHRYNTRRRHSRLGQRSPIAFENVFHVTPTTLAPAA